MTDTPRCNALESNPLDSFDHRAWITLAKRLEREAIIWEERCHEEERNANQLARDLSAPSETKPMKCVTCGLYHGSHTHEEWENRFAPSAIEPTWEPCDKNDQRYLHSGFVIYDCKYISTVRSNGDTYDHFVAPAPEFK